MKTTRMLTILVLAFGLATQVANADFTFGTPTNLGPTINSPQSDRPGSISADGLTLFFASGRAGGSGGHDIWVTTRETKDDEWGTPMNLGPTINSPHSDFPGSFSSDGLEMYFDSNRIGGSWDTYDIYVSRRTTTDDAWGTPVKLGPPVNSLGLDVHPIISTDGLSLYFTSLDRAGGYGSLDLWVATRATVSDPWGEPSNLGPTINTSQDDAASSISPDGLVLYFYRKPRGPYDYGDIYMSTRPTTNDAWGEPVNLGPTVNSSYNDAGPSISADGLTLFFVSNRPGGMGGSDIWQAPIIPLVDFNGDGIVETNDLLTMIEYWGTGEPLCDIGPMPWGDGIVDDADLEVLMSYWGQAVEDPTLVAHWKLDETEGSIVYDSAGNYDGTLNGNPLWQPTGGKVDGALAFDGTDDYVSTDHILDPADGVFSVVVWIKGSAPGQVIISQTNGAGTGANWLSADSLEGNLMTELKTLGRGGNVPIVSETVITDGNWHRIGFVWDGSYRYLYVDGAEVAKDTASFSMLESSDGGLYLGAGKDLDAASFFSGLIDDVRIYNRAISP